LLPEDFAANAPGRIIRSVLGHWTFTPNPLPPPLSIDLPLVRKLSEADQALGQLAGVGRRLPNPHLLIRPFISREAVLSSRIEGTVTSLDQLFLFEAQPDEIHHPADAEEVLNYVLAVEHGLEQIRRGFPFSLHLLREVHKILMQGGSRSRETSGRNPFASGPARSSGADLRECSLRPSLSYQPGTAPGRLRSLSPRRTRIAAHHSASPDALPIRDDPSVQRRQRPRGTAPHYAYAVRAALLARAAAVPQRFF